MTHDKLAHRKIINRIVISLIVLLSLFASRANAATLDVAVEDAAGPWSEKDGTGFANDVVKAAFRAVGIEPKLRILPYARCKYLVKKGDVPVCFSVSPEPGIEDDVWFSKLPLFRLQYDYYQRLDTPLKSSAPNTPVPGTVIGIVNGYEYPPSIEQAKENGVKFENARDEQTNIRKLLHNRLDGVILNHNEIKTIAVMLKKAGATGKVGFAFRAGDLNAYVGFSKKHALGKRAKQKFDRGHALIKQSGTLKRIEDEWIRRINVE